jgi:uncharacterized membrane protein YbaN (DUF454 family)
MQEGKMIDSRVWEYASIILFGSIALADLKDIDLVLLILSRISATVFFVVRAVCFFKKLKKYKND